MNKLALAITTSLALGSLSASAEEKEIDKYWVGGYGIYYTTDDKPADSNLLDDGFGVGAEFGFRFTPKWAARIEYAALEIDSDNTDLLPDDSGSLFGIDALYFLKNDIAYLFTGLKLLNLDEDYTQINLGIGRHWPIDEHWKVITEAAYYRGDGGDTDFGVKFGLAYTFGKQKVSYNQSKPTYTAPLDSDNDGVIDDKDNCPTTPAGDKVDNNGCTMVAKVETVEKDSDRDGVVDSADKCPKTPYGDVVDADGCTRFGEKEVSQRVEVLFANNSAKITNPSAPDIVDFANFMQRYGKTEAVIEGHASAPGDAAYNKQLSAKRAQAFLDLLVNRYGIAASRLTAVGYGEERLLDSSNTAEAHKKNRRIVVNVTEKVKVKITE